MAYQKTSSRSRSLLLCESDDKNAIHNMFLANQYHEINNGQQIGDEERGGDMLDERIKVLLWLDGETRI